jgi:hypothetical protein
MLYVLKIIRDTRTNQITVSGITPAPDYIAPYNKKYGAYTVEALRVFPNLKSAKLALKWEKLAASNSILSDEKKRKKFKSLAKYAREYIGWAYRLDLKLFFIDCLALLGFQPAMLTHNAFFEMKRG